MYIHDGITIYNQDVCLQNIRFCANNKKLKLRWDFFEGAISKQRKMRCWHKFYKYVIKQPYIDRP